MSLSRRVFLGGCAAGGAAVWLGLPGCGNPVSAPPFIDAAFDGSGKVAIEVARFPDLAPVGGAVTVRLSTDGLIHPFSVPLDGMLLVHRGAPGDEPEFIAFSGMCPHAQCPLGYSTQDLKVECPCHGSQFRAVADPNDPTTYPGQVLHLPAMADIAHWDVTFLGGVAVIDLNKKHYGLDMPPVVDGNVVIPLNQFGQLTVIGGSIVGQPAGLADTLVVVRTGDATVAALSSVCPHVGCNVAYDVNKNDLVCPCHGSTFTLATGAVTKGPAVSNLKVYPATFDGPTITVKVK
jgi:Rieske Fe-S protein